MSSQALIFSRGIWRIPHLAAFLPEYQLTRAHRACQRVQAACVLGWGYRPSTHKARAYAQRHGLPYIALEDGFIRSLGLGVDGYPPLSMVVDDLGMYYDATRPSRLQRLIDDASCLHPDEIAQAERAMQIIVSQQLSKYNHAPSLVPSREATREVVLVIDQTHGDMSLQYGGVNTETFAQMLQAACTENPDAEIWCKTHPDVLNGKKQGCLHLQNLPERVRILAHDVNPIALLQTVDKVYCATSQMGFEALLCGKHVCVFGLAWYAGYGLTDDRHPNAGSLQRPTRTLTQLFAAAYLHYTRYINPYTGEAGTLFDVLAYLQHVRAHNELLRGDLYCVGVSLWKRTILQPFLRLPACRVHFVKNLTQLAACTLPSHAKILAWGHGKQAILDFAAARQLPVIRMEDGFIRSVGLGSNLVPPLSLVFDDLGIYFNPQQPSRLESILQNHEFTEQDEQLTQKVQAALLHQRISKYNVGAQQFTRPEHTTRVLLVIGQVEDDASIRLGAPQICRNLDLLRTVRERNPDAYIVYKPHPDVVSGNRVGKIDDADVYLLANVQAAECDIVSCVEAADEVHTMTSLTGFEALLRGKCVHCYGQPFYAGWGLTVDEIAIPRRTRCLQLWQLVSGTLLHYPMYVQPNTGQRMDVLSAIAWLQQQKPTQGGAGSLHRNRFSKQYGKIRQLWRVWWRN